MSGNIGPLTHSVYVKKVRTPGSSFDGSPVGAPTDGGFTIDYSIRCLMFSCILGASVGRADFDFISQDGGLPEFEHVLNTYTTDDQIRVTVSPMDHEVLGVELPDGVSELTVFEGVIERMPFSVGLPGARDDERVDFIAMPLPALDNVAPEHLITGRWVAVDPTAQTIEPAVIESLDLPAAFNLGGKPNRSDQTVNATLSGLAGHVFTHDRDPNGSYWTVAEAIRSILVMWGFGPDSATALPRGFDLDKETLAAIMADTAPEGRRWEGLDAMLPEINVHGMGVLEAIDAVCDAAGFELAVMPHYGLKTEYDRLYVLGINRIGGGTEAFFKLEPRGAFASDDHNEVLRNNSVSTFRGTRDAARIRNQIMSVGHAYVEAALQLKPLWLPSQVTQDTTDTNYTARHVRGGAEFAAYRRVGRAWGIDCLGTWAATAGGYSNAIYQHPSGGFDWVSELGLTGGGSELVADRLANGNATPIVWTRKMRNLLPLKRAEAQANGQQYIVEVTEDGGSTWTEVDIQITTLQEECGLQLGIQDLSKINLASLENPSLIPAPEDSWWGLMFPTSGGGQPQFAVRVTCCVAADHGATALAPRRSSAGSVYPRQRLVRSATEEVWSVPGSILNTSGELQRIEGWGTTAYTDRLPPLDLAERERDAHETLRVSAAATTWAMDFWLWFLGDRVSQLQGRNYRFDISADGDRSPSIAGIYVTLSGKGEEPEKDQNIRLALSDTSYIGGRR
ncbi:hypothetical protein [Algisphaera agarilytica]|uniref:Phage tail protein n=1 Tax=Algisphaera agarilytica TaxID=1385975 RepID=A0A7X0LJD5_9BACT|nr:hypothetical protein [Algisphaera agarilytica]MBB6429225.1 hypothetical protein [Algisphaera agarilytica]